MDGVKGEASTVFFVFFFADLFEVFGEGNLETLFIMFVEAIILECI